jgi:hypothetical protein
MVLDGGQLWWRKANNAQVDRCLEEEMTVTIEIEMGMPF